MSSRPDLKHERLSATNCGQPFVFGPNNLGSIYRSVNEVQSTNRTQHGSTAVCCNSFSADTLPSSNPIATLMRL